MPPSGVEALCRAAGVVSSKRLPAPMLERNLSSPSAFATPAENPREYRHRCGRGEPLI